MPFIYLMACDEESYRRRSFQIQAKALSEEDLWIERGQKKLAY